MEGIDLRLSDVDPPLPDPKRTIYRDIYNLPDPVILGMTIRYFNLDDVTLYFQITGSGAGYTFTPVNLGSLGSGTNAYINLDNFVSRAKPSAGSLTNGELDEQITLTLNAYTDAGYSILKWTFNRIVSVKFINSNDPAFTVDFLNNFDDGTIQGWAVANEQNNFTAGGYPSIAVSNAFSLSAPYSVRMEQACVSGTWVVRARLYKSFATPNRTHVYAIMNIRSTQVYGGTEYLKRIEIQKDGTLLIYLGKGGDYVASHYVPINKWMRIVVPLPSNTTVEVRIVQEWYGNNTGFRLYMDDFTIVSKN